MKTEVGLVNFFSEIFRGKMTEGGRAAERPKSNVLGGRGLRRGMSKPRENRIEEEMNACLTSMFLPKEELESLLFSCLLWNNLLYTVKMCLGQDAF